MRSLPARSIEGEYQVQMRYRVFFAGDEDKNKDRELIDGQVAFYRAKWEDLSEFVKDIKQCFSRFYNKRHNRRGFFWAERFKSVIVDPPDSPDNRDEYIIRHASCIEISLPHKVQCTARAAGGPARLA